MAANGASLGTRVIPYDRRGLVLYAVTLLGELVSAFVRGYLFGTLVALALFVTGHDTQPAAIPLGILAGALPLVWSLAGLVGVFGSGAWWWKSTSGARVASTRERAAYEPALEQLIGSEVRPRAPRSVYVLDDSEPNAAVCGNTLMLSRGLIGSPGLTPVLAHELGHLNTSDARITLALNRLVLRPPSTRPRQPASGLLGLLVQLLLAIAAGGSGLVLTRPLWSAYWREREYRADEYAAWLGQGAQLAQFLDGEVILYDRPVPFVWMSRVGHPPTELRIDALTTRPPSEPAQPRSGSVVLRAAAMLAVAVVAVAVVVVVGFGSHRTGARAGSAAGTGGSGGAGRSGGADQTSQTAVEQALVGVPPPNFDDVGTAHDASCRPTAKPSVFDCSWKAADDSPGHGRWELYQGTLARISDGGDTGVAPASDAQASQVVGTVLRERGRRDVVARCRELIIESDPSAHPPPEYTCEPLVHGRPLATDLTTGDPSRTVWSWNPDGSVANENADTSPVADEQTR